MSNDTLQPKIELLEEQIENFERSGYFTDAEINRMVAPLRMELATFKLQQHSNLNEVAKAFGISTEQLVEGRRIFAELWSKMDNFLNPVFNIEVIDAEILTPNHITA